MLQKEFDIAKGLYHDALEYIDIKNYRLARKTLNEATYYFYKSKRLNKKQKEYLGYIEEKLKDIEGLIDN